MKDSKSNSNIRIDSMLEVSMRIETMLVFFRKISLKVGIYFVLYLVSSTIPTATLTRLSITGFQGVMSFSYNLLPSNVITKKDIGRTTHGIVVGQKGRNTKYGLAVRESQSLFMVHGGPPTEGYSGEGDGGSYRLGKSFETALAIVPPLKDWDRLQRARHFARDPLFRDWPPAIRLFHPFCESPDIAFEIAQLVEDLDIEAFEITLDSWVILPNLEAEQLEWKKQESLPRVEEAGTSESYFQRLDREADEKVKKHIDAVEKKGQKKAKRNQKRNANSSVKKKSKEKKSPAEVRDEQRKSIEEDFGGPCVLCIEPDEESKEKLMELREMLREGIDIPSYSSPSSLYEWEFVDINMGYRPLIPISKFSSIRTAMDTACRLKGLWGDPLTINVKSMEILSCKVPEDFSGDYSDEEYKASRFGNGFVPGQNQYDVTENSWGCNAMIKLVGEEIQQDDTANKKMIKQLLEEGERGGGDISMDFTILDDEEESATDIEKWLNTDDDFDEGTEVVIGRTHFFTGDKRNYNGMPATSAVDAKDRALGDFGSVSGVARRRGAITRGSNVWEEGEYGRRTRDYSPFRPKKTKG